MWNILASTHDRANNVYRESKSINPLRWYKLFKMIEGVTIVEMVGWFQIVLNDFRAKRKKYTVEENNIKFLNNHL